MLITLLLISLICTGQTKIKEYDINQIKENNMSELIVKKEFEIFDFETFEANKNKERNEYERTLSSGTYISMAKTDLELYYEEIPSKSLYSITKVYYPNGNIKKKGVGYVYFFKKGTWYYYDENGKLIEEINHDAPFKFTLTIF